MPKLNSRHIFLTWVGMGPYPHGGSWGQINRLATVGPLEARIPFVGVETRVAIQGAEPMHGRRV